MIHDPNEVSGYLSLPVRDLETVRAARKQAQEDIMEMLGGGMRNVGPRTRDVIIERLETLRQDILDQVDGAEDGNRYLDSLFGEWSRALAGEIYNIKNLKVSAD